MLTLLVLLGASVLPATAAPPDVDALASGFVRGLGSGDMEALAALSTEEAMASMDWQLLRGVLEAYDCVSIPSHEVSVEAAAENELTLLVTVHATAVAKSARRSPRHFPEKWRVTARPSADGWKFQSIVVEERAMARRLAAVPELSPEMILACAETVDPETLLMHLGEEFLGSPQPWRPASLEVVRSVARDHGYVLAEVTALRSKLSNALRKDAGSAGSVATEMRSVAEASGMVDALAVAYLASGMIDWQERRHEAALRHYAAAAALLDVVDDPRAPMKALYMGGALLTHRGAYRDALMSAVALTNAAERYDWAEGRCIASFQKSTLFSDVQDFLAARHHARTAMRCSEGLRYQAFVVMALSDVAVTEKRAGNEAEAARLLRRILDRATADRATQTAVAAVRSDLAKLLAKGGRYAAAEAELQTALSITREFEERLFEADILGLLAQVRLLDGRTAEALRTAEEADAIIRDATLFVGWYRNDVYWLIRATLGSTLRAAGRLPEATAALYSSIEMIEAKRSVLGSDELMLSGFMSNKAKPYHDLVSLLVQQGRPRDAVIITERFRARALGTAMARGHVDRLPAMSAADEERYVTLNESISALNRTLFASGDEAANAPLRAKLLQHRIELKTFLSRLYAGRPDIRARNADDPQTVIGDARRLLPHKEEALLTYSMHDHETFAFLLERSGDEVEVTVHRIAMEKEELEERIRELVAQIEGRNLDYRRSAASLYDLLVGPFASRLRAKQLLYIVPDGMLWRLPFQALQAPDGEHLIEHIAVAYAPSLTLLRNEPGDVRPPQATRTLLAIADPDLPLVTGPVARAATRDASLAPLPDARTEVREIAKLYGHSSRTLIGAEATEEAAKRLAASFPVLHLATHGIIDDASPMYSAIVLGSSGSDDGLLEAREMMDLHLGADLAILSACDSASGDLTPGEGMVGMSWALMVAGCRNTVVSQWKVDSASTAKLMIAFHREVSRHDASYASALRQAQRTLLREEKFSHPYYWSPFVLVSTSQ